MVNQNYEVNLTVATLVSIINAKIYLKLYYKNDEKNYNAC